MSFVYPRQIRFHETDGAGVVYFANVLTLCHEAYEASLALAGIDLQRFFSPGESGWAVPVVHASVDFFRPLYCGDRIRIHLQPQRLSPHSFEIVYALWPEDVSVEQVTGDRPQAQALTRHVCISTQQRQRLPLPAELEQWLEQVLCRDSDLSAS